MVAKKIDAEEETESKEAEVPKGTCPICKGQGYTIVGVLKRGCRHDN